VLLLLKLKRIKKEYKKEKTPMHFLSRHCHKAIPEEQEGKKKKQEEDRRKKKTRKKPQQ